MGVFALWLGNESSMFLANPVIDYEGRLLLTRGENWSAPADLANSDVTGEPGYVAFNTPILKRTRVAEGDVAWIAGKKFIEAYNDFIEGGGDDVLEISSWRVLTNGCALKVGRAFRFYDLGAALANETRHFYESRISQNLTEVDKASNAARFLYAGCVGVDSGERSVADALWFFLNSRYEEYKRSVMHASILQGVDESSIEAEIENRAAFYERDLTKSLKAEILRLKEQVAALQPPLHSGSQSHAHAIIADRGLGFIYGDSGLSNETSVDALVRSFPKFYGVGFKAKILSRVSRDDDPAIVYLDVDPISERMENDV